MKINLFWFRRDLRLEDNTALYNALRSGLPVLPLFIFDTNITAELPHDDARIGFIYDTLTSINKELSFMGSSVLVKKGDPASVWNELTAALEINSVFLNKDYEPYAIQRDNSIEKILKSKGISMFRFKDQVIAEEREILKDGGTPYTVFTPYSKKWRQQVEKNFRPLPDLRTEEKGNFFRCSYLFPSLEEIGFKKSMVKAREYDLSVISSYDRFRDLPAEDKTSYLSPHFRFGTVSPRKITMLAAKENQVFLGELIWREFFMQILFNFPKVVTENFKPRYDNIQWRNNEAEFERWCKGDTGYPLVDAGMRQLNDTGYLHNRVRMVTAGFLVKHLLIDWRWGEAYFAGKLLDYELSSNNGNWQWAAGTGCDAAPYFRIFNPASQMQKFDSKSEYVRRWIPDLDLPGYSEAIVDHTFARNRAITTYKEALK